MKAWILFAIGLVARLAAALVTTAIIVTLVQTQFNLARIIALGVEIPAATRLQATAHDLLQFTPSATAMLLPGLLIAFAVAGPLAARLAWPATAVHALAGLVAVITTFVLMNALLPVTMVPASTGTGGLLTLGLAGAAGGWLFARLGDRR